MVQGAPRRRRQLLLGATSARGHGSPRVAVEVVDGWGDRGTRAGGEARVCEDPDPGFLLLFIEHLLGGGVRP